MNNFVQYAPTRVVFGKGTETQAGDLIKADGGSRVFVVYGGGSAVKSGLLGRVTKSIEDAGLISMTYGGVKPNPTLAHAEEGVRMAVEFGADYILGVGGGSVIDTAKAIAHGTSHPDADLWDIWFKKVKITKSLPIACVLTIAAAGSEMSADAVLTNEEDGKKKGFGTELNRCRFAIMNPELLCSVPDYFFFAGVADIMMHTMERYFIPGIKCDVKENRNDYDANAEIMWAGALSHNDLTECGRGKDFSVHKLGQQMGGMFDLVHGATITAVWSAWAVYLYKDCPSRFSQYARRVWGVTEEDDIKASEEGIRRTVAFFREIGMPVSIKEMGITPSEEEIDRLSLEASYFKTITITKIKPVDYEGIKEMYHMAMDGVEV